MDVGEIAAQKPGRHFAGHGKVTIDIVRMVRVNSVVGYPCAQARGPAYEGLIAVYLGTEAVRELLADGVRDISLLSSLGVSANIRVAYRGSTHALFLLEKP